MQFGPGNTRRFVEFLRRLAGSGSERRRGGLRPKGSAHGALEALEQRSLLSATWVEGDVIVRAESPEVAEALADQFGGSEIRPVGNYGLYHLQLPTNLQTADVISDLTGQEGILAAEPNWIGEWLATPNDPDYGELWGLHNTGQTVNGVTGVAGADISAETAWDLTTGTSAIVAIVDSGMDYTHPDLAANMWVNTGEIPGNGVDDDGNGFIDDINGWDTADNDNDPRDFIGHGTHVGGTVGAVGDNGIGSTGVNWNVQLMALKIGADLGGPTTLGAIEAINYAVANGASVSNHSYTVTPTQALDDAITNAGNNNHIVVVAAGNSNSNNDVFPTFPASYPHDNIVTVAATNQLDDRASFSNFGVTSVDIGAPGVNIWSTTPEAGSAFYGPDYDFSDGTSMAAPHVAGVIGFLQGLAPSLPYTEIIDAVYLGADPVANLDGLVATGARLNLANAIPFLAPARISVSPDSVAENAGTDAATITITKSTAPIDTDLVVELFVNDMTEVAVPALGGGNTLLIPAGQRSITVSVDALDDTLLDGTQVVTFDLHVGGSSVGTATLDVTDHESLSADFADIAIRENDGPNATTLRIERSNTDIFGEDSLIAIDNELRRFDDTGAVTEVIPVEWHSGIRPVGEGIRDAIVLENGNIAVYNGTQNAAVSIYNPNSNAWVHHLIPGLSTSTLDTTRGGLSSWGDYVFVTDLDAGGDTTSGLLRLNIRDGVFDRFGDTTLGPRLFATSFFEPDLMEIDPQTGAIINRITVPPGLSLTSQTGAAYDGTDVWIISEANDVLYRINGDTGALVETRNINFPSSGFQGMAYLNGELFFLDAFINNRIYAYNPQTQQIDRIFTSTNFTDLNLSGGLAAHPDTGMLYVTSTFGGELYEINAITGELENTYVTGFNSQEGVAAVGDELYISHHTSNNLEVFSLNGIFQRSVDVSEVFADFFSLAGDGVDGLVPTAQRYRDITVGLDGRVYALDQDLDVVSVFDAETLAPLDVITLANPVTTIAADASGRIFAGDAGANLLLFNPDGTLAQLTASGAGLAQAVDIEVNALGEVLMGTEGGQIITTDTSFTAPVVQNSDITPTFVTFGQHPTDDSVEITVSLANLDPSEIGLPDTVTLGRGVKFVDIPVDAVDDNLRDGVQTATVVAESPGYIGANASVAVQDAEFVHIDIVADEVSEADGAGASQVIITRTDIDGPYTFLSDQSESNLTPATILDRDTILSPIVIPTQVSELTDVNVELTLTHGWLGDLDVFLVSPNGTRVELFTDLSSNETLMTKTVLDDEAPLPILDGMAPYTGSFLPESPLSAFDGENPAGTWYLEITDDNTSDVGQLVEWHLSISTVGLDELVADIIVSDTTEGQVTRQVTIPANQAQVIVNLDAIDDDLLDGPQTVVVSADTSSVPGLDLGSDSAIVNDSEVLTFTVSTNSVSEAAGAAALTGTLTRGNSDISAPYTASLSSSDTSELIVPATVTIPAGETSVTFDIAAVDDALIDGDQNVTITVTAPEYGDPLTADVLVTDREPSVAIAAESASVREDAGFLRLTLTRIDDPDLSLPRVVNLHSSDTSELQFASSSVTIPGGALTHEVLINVVDDDLLDGAQSVTLTTSATGLIPSTLNLDVTDAEQLTLTANSTSFLENGGEQATIGFVSRPAGQTSGALIVSLTGNDATEFTVPVSVTIPDGQTQASFPISAVNDPELDGAQDVVLTATAVGYLDGTLDLTVLDHEPPVLLTPGAVVTDSTPDFTWSEIPGAVKYDIWVSNLSTGTSQVIRDTDIDKDNYTAPEPLGIGLYRVWVRGIDQFENPGFWSDGLTFRVATAPSIVTPGAGDTASTEFPEISWNAVADAVRYDVWVDHLTSSQSQIIRNQNVPVTSLQVDTPMPAGSYRVWVRGFNANGDAGNWTAARDFSVVAQPVITGPAGNSFNRIPEITWDAVNGATHYDVWVSDASTGRVLLRDEFVEGTAVRMPGDLSNGTYRAWVRAYVNDTPGQWSVVHNFSIAQPPVIQSPSQSTVVGANPQFSWEAVGDITTYELWVSRHVGGTQTRAIYETALTTTVYTPSAALLPGDYSVWLRATSEMGERTSWSEETRFSVELSQVESVSDDGSDGQLILWSEQPEAGTTYEIAVHEVTADGRTPQVIRETVPGSAYTATGLTSGNYRVWVRSLSASGVWSNWSSGFDFTVADTTEQSDGQIQSAGEAYLLTSVVTPVPVAPVESAAAQLSAPVAATTPDAPSAYPVTSPEVEEDHGETTAADVVLADWDQQLWWQETSELPPVEATVAPETDGMSPAIAVAAGLLTTRRSNRERRSRRN